LGIVFAVVVVTFFALKMKDYCLQKKSMETMGAGDGPVSVNELELTIKMQALNKSHSLEASHYEAIAKMEASKTKLGEFLAKQGLQNK
jgi:hypothetical protein